MEQFFNRPVFFGETSIQLGNFSPPGCENFVKLPANRPKLTGQFRVGH